MWFYGRMYFVVYGSFLAFWLSTMSKHFVDLVNQLVVSALGAPTKPGLPDETLSTAKQGLANQRPVVALWLVPLRRAVTVSCNWWFVFPENR